MGDEKKKWSVTYTKHVKQKRKVYQDGFLELHSSTHKANLYDDCDKLLGCKIVKNDDEVKTGETLAFDSYLVDIGDPHGDYKPILKVNTQMMNKKIKVESGLMHSEKSSASVDNRKPNLGKRRAGLSNLSPSQKIIREFKKSEVRKYGSSPNSLDLTNSSTKEWQVLYTTQITQKAKKFHDGFLWLVMSGTHSKQIMLYDETRRLLDSRFLKKNESIMSGESVTFDGHLVEIGECEEDQNPPVDITPQRKHIKELREGAVQGEVTVHNKLPAEWDAMYTTQITQKAKKYNNGILRLSSCGSYQSQVTLLAEDGSTLCRRFLKLSEHVTTGTTLNLPNYLVEVGDVRASAEGNLHEGGSSREDAQSDIKLSGLDNVKLSGRISFNNPIPNRNLQEGGSSREDAQSDIKVTGLDNVKLSRKISFNNPIPNRNPQNKAFSLDRVDLTTASCTLDNATNCRISRTNLVRPAHEILSILKKPFTSESAGRVRDSTCEDERQLLQSPSLVYSDIIKSQTEDLMQDLNVRGRNISELKVTDAFHLDGISQPFDCANQRVSDPQSLNSCTGLGATVICSRDVEYTVTERRSPTMKLKHLAIPESDSKDQAVEILGHDKSDKVPDIEMNSHDSAPQFPCHLPEMKAEGDITTYNMDEFPSFDLGF